MYMIPNPIRYIDPLTGVETGRYLPPILEEGKLYRKVAIRKCGWGTLVKTDRLDKWININWFIEWKG